MISFVMKKEIEGYTRFYGGVNGVPVCVELKDYMIENFTNETIEDILKHEIAKNIKIKIIDERKINDNK